MSDQERVAPWGKKMNPFPHACTFWCKTNSHPPSSISSDSPSHSLSFLTLCPLSLHGRVSLLSLAHIASLFQGCVRNCLLLAIWPRYLPRLPTRPAPTFPRRPSHKDANSLGDFFQGTFCFCAQCAPRGWITALTVNLPVGTSLFPGALQALCSFMWPLPGSINIKQVKITLYS